MEYFINQLPVNTGIIGIDLVLILHRDRNVIQAVNKLVFPKRIDQIVTPDLGGTSTTDEVTDTIIKTIKKVGQHNYEPNHVW